jgi:hypothetical protein
MAVFVAAAADFGSGDKGGDFMGQVVSQAADYPDDGIIYVELNFIGIQRAFRQQGRHLLCCQYM